MDFNKISNCKLKRIVKWQRQKVKQVKHAQHNVVLMTHCPLCHAQYARPVAKRNVHITFARRVVQNNYGTENIKGRFGALFCVTLLF